jgi:hypothetical protein
MYAHIPAYVGFAGLGLCLSWNFKRFFFTHFHLFDFINILCAERLRL